MNFSACLSMNQLDAEALRELRTYIDFLNYKSKLRKTKVYPRKKQFAVLSIDTKGFKFDRDEANER